LPPKGAFPMKTVKKKDIAQRTAKLLNEKVYTTEKIVDGLFTSLRQIMMEADGEIRIEIRNFGVLKVKKMKAKLRARNPKTGEIFHVPAHRKAHFKPGKILKDVLRKPLEED